MRPLLLLALALSVAACDSSSASRSIARTDASGTIIEDDAGDWQPRCAQPPAGFCARPAFPNPVPADGAVTLVFHNPVRQSVEVRLGEGVFVSEPFAAGLQTVTVPVADFALGFVEVEIEPAEQGDQISGDLLIENP